MAAVDWTLQPHVRGGLEVYADDFDLMVLLLINHNPHKIVDLELILFHILYRIFSEIKILQIVGVAYSRPLSLISLPAQCFFLALFSQFQFEILLQGFLQNF